jgi:hypothetical protein
MAVWCSIALSIREKARPYMQLILTPLVPGPYRLPMLLPPRLPWQHPWLTVQLLLRRILHEPWPDDQWREIRKEIPTVLKERERIRKERWFN